MKQHNIIVEKTARYFTIGEAGPQVKQVLFACHGYAQLANEFLLPLGTLQRDDLLIVAPEGLHRFYARGSSDKVVASWMTKEDRSHDIHDYVQYLDKVYAEVMRGLAPGIKVSVLGFSQGAATVSRWAAMSSVRIDELILFCGFFPPDLPPQGIPATTQLIVVTASEDKFISPQQEKEQLETMCRLAPGMKHVRFEGLHVVDLPTLSALLDRRG